MQVMADTAPKVDLADARRFLEWLDPEAEFFTYQTFQDVRKSGPAFILHGSLDEQGHKLIELNEAGDGIFVCVNATNRKGRSKATIARIRALYLDLDGAPLEPVMTCEQPPHAVVESSPGKFHCYWLVEGVDKFAAEQYLGALIKRFDGDPACKDCSRVLRLPGYIHRKKQPFRVRIVHLEDQMPLQIEAIEGDLCKVTAKPASSEDRDPLFRDEESGKVDWKALDAALKGKTPNAWHAAIVKATSSLLGHGVPEDLIVEILLHYRWPEYSDGETRRHIVTAIEGARKKGYGVSIQPILGPEWRAGLIYGQRGPLAISENAITALRMAPEWQNVLALDELSNRIVFRKAPPCLDAVNGHQWLDREFHEHDDARLAGWLQRQGIRVGHDIAGKCAATVASENAYNPLRDYLGSLQWDGTPRVEDWLTRHLGVARSPYVDTVARCTLVAAVARALNPGCKADHMLVLIGSQGLGKSSVVRALARGWYTSAVPDLRSKDAMIQVQGAWVCEMEELESFRATKDVTAIKSFLSRQTDQFRPPYGRTIVDVPRRCIFIGTTNESEIFSDATGNRRFWPVECTKHADISVLEMEVDQLWAEAVVLYEAGEPWHLTDEEVRQAAAKEQDARVQVIDTWAEVIEEKLAGVSETHSRLVLTQYLGYDLAKVTRREEMEVARVLKRLGFSRNHTRNGKAWSRSTKNVC